MYMESQALLRTMLALMDQGIPSFSVHDSLIAPLAKKQTAATILKELYEAVTEATPHIVTKGI